MTPAAEQGLSPAVAGMVQFCPFRRFLSCCSGFCPVRPDNFHAVLRPMMQKNTMAGSFLQINTLS
jgi:hypothetical protein